MGCWSAFGVRVGDSAGAGQVRAARRPAAGRSRHAGSRRSRPQSAGSGRRVSGRTSAAGGAPARPATWRGPRRSSSSPAHRANVCFTIRSSSEWYASTSTRPSRAEEVHRLVEAVGEVRQLAVHLHADRLERAARRVRAAPAGRRRDRVAHDVGELARRGERPGRDDRMRDAAGEPLLAVARDHVRELALRRSC